MKMKKILGLVLAATMSFAVVGCTSEPKEDTNVEQNKEEETPETVKITTVNGKDEEIEVDFPYDPQRIVVLNYQTLDFLDAMGLGDRVVGVIEGGSTPEHLKKYQENEDIVKVGGMKDYDMEAIMELEPDAIFSSDRSAKNYDNFVKIAPTMAAFVDYDNGFLESYKELAETHSTIFGLGDKVDETIAGYEERIEKIAEFAEGKTALLGIFAGGLNTLGDEGRASIITNEMGFENLAGDVDVNHGNISSYELFLELDPEYMFILDKDTAVGAEGSTLAKDQMDNEIIQQTQAYKNDKIIYLEPGSVWYMADGGITGMDLMLSNIEDSLGL